MRDSEAMFSNPFWYALNTEHSDIAIGSTLVRRYPADIIPFAGLAQPSVEALSELRNLLAPQESIVVTGDHLPSVEAIEDIHELPGWQMHPAANPASSSPAQDSVELRALGEPDAPAMVALTDVAFPGYFRAKTYVLGRYFGIHVDGQLVSMAGERVSLPGYREISAVCTHPAHTGRGYAALLIQRLRCAHSAAGLHSFLHVAAENARAIQLYERLGFVKTRAILFHQLLRRY